MKNKGFTMIELIIAISLLSVISTPFINSFLKSMEINRKTENTIEANYIAQKFLEDIKFSDDLTAFPATQEYQGFTVDINFSDITNTLKISKSGTTVSNGGYVLPSSYDMEIRYYETLSDGSKIRISSTDYESTSDQYTIKIENHSEGSDLLTVTILYPNEVSLAPINTGGDSFSDIKILVGEGISEKGKLTLNNLSDKKIKFYEFDDKNDDLQLEPLVSINSGDVEIINNLDTISQDGNNNYKLYSVEISVSKNGIELEKLISTVKK